MKRPYVICHILSALNGRISGPFMGTAAALPAAQGGRAAPADKGGAHE